MAGLQGADLTGAYTYLTNFTAVDLSKVVGLTQEQVNVACGDPGTILPSGMERPDVWSCID